MRIFNNAFLWMSDQWSPDPLAIWTEKGQIVKIGKALVGNELSQNEICDLNAGYLYPGFIDTHTHSFEGGLYSLGVDLSKCQNIPEVLAKLDSEKSGGASEDTLFAWQLDENKLIEERFPTVAELDSVVPNRALILRRIDGHSCVLNSYARALLPSLDVPTEILRGKDNDKAVHYFHGKLSPEAILQAYHAAARIAIEGGFTGLHTMIGDADYSIGHYELIRDNLDSFPISFTLYPQSFNLRAALDAGATRIGGCILADGSIGSQTAALSDPYLNSLSRGVLYQSDIFWQDFIGRASEQGLQVAVHAIGDRAIRQINDIYLNLPGTAYLRHQLIHCEITPDDLLHEITASGATAVMQPNFDLLWGGEKGFYAGKLGLERSRQMNRFSTLTKSGVKVCGGSDWYITVLDAAFSIRATLQHHNPNERLSHAEAIDIYTTNAAWLSQEENSRGKIAEGCVADFSVYSNPLDNHDRMPELKAVICKGEAQYDRK